LLSSLASLGWDEQFAADFSPLQNTCTPARVTRIDRGAADLRTADGDVRVEVAPGYADLAVGDWVALDDAGLVRVLTRRTAVVRAAASGESRVQTLVANVDDVLVTAAAFPAPRLEHIERLVALAWDSGATPSIVLTKADLLVEPRRLLGEVGRAAPGCEVQLVSAQAGEGLETLRAYDTIGRTLCLVGRSGAGKSTLANALLGTDAMEVSEVRRDGKGRHTTTHRQLIELPAGGVLIDTPGLRGVGVWLEGGGREQAFSDVEELAQECRFRDCAHETEPGCAVRAAVEAGELEQRRIDSWRKLGREAAWIAARSDVRLHRERMREWRRLSAESRGQVRP
jgi:ribosome biogenesis GTPase